MVEQVKKQRSEKREKILENNRITDYCDMMDSLDMKRKLSYSEEDGPNRKKHKTEKDIWMKRDKIQKKMEK